MLTKCFIRVILYKRYGTLCGSLAQLGEQRPYKAWVVGSSPSTSTIYSGEVAKWLNAVDCKSIPNGFGGSNLPLSTIFVAYRWGIAKR